MKSTDAYYFEFDPKIQCFIVKRNLKEVIEESQTLNYEQPNKTNKKSKTNKKQ